MRLSKAWAYDTFTLEAYLDMLNVTISQEVVGLRLHLGRIPGGVPSSRKPIGLPVVLPILGIKGRY